MHPQNQIARNSQIAAARQRIAAQRGQVPGGAQAANMAGCGTGPGMGYGGHGGYGCGLPAQQAPVIPNYGPGLTLRQRLAPCSAIVRVQDVAASTTIELAPRGGAVFYGCGIRTLNDPFQVVINSLETGSLEYDLIPCDGVDAAYWNTDECFCPMDIGCVTNVSPLTIEFSAFGTPSSLPFLNFIAVGTRDSGWQDCGYYPGFGYPPGAQPGAIAGPGHSGPGGRAMGPGGGYVPVG